MGTESNRELVKGPPRRDVKDQPSAEARLREELRALRKEFETFRHQVAGVRKAQRAYFAVRRKKDPGHEQLRAAQLRESALDSTLERLEPGILRDSGHGALFD